MLDVAKKVPALIVDPLCSRATFRCGVVRVPPSMESAAKTILNEMALGIETKQSVLRKIERRFFLSLCS